MLKELSLEKCNCKLIFLWDVSCFLLVCLSLSFLKQLQLNDLLQYMRETSGVNLNLVCLGQTNFFQH